MVHFTNGRASLRGARKRHMTFAVSDPCLPAPDTGLPHGGEEERPKEDAVIRCQRHQQIITTWKFSHFEQNLQLNYRCTLSRPCRMMMASQCVEQAVQEFLMEKGGRVQQMELIDHFLSAWRGNDRSKGEVDREVLKHVVDNVGFVRVENGVKFVCLNTSGNADSAMRTDADVYDHAERNRNIQETLDNCVNGNPDNGAQSGEDYCGDLIWFNPRLTISQLSSVLYLQCICKSIYYCICYKSDQKVGYRGTGHCFCKAVLQY